MFIPEWVFWIIGGFVTLGLANYFGRSTGDYDFVSPLIAVGIVLIGIALAAGYLIATILK